MTVWGSSDNQEKVDQIATASIDEIQIIKEEVGDQVKIIGVGGIISKESAISKLDSGADLLQMYTGLVYKGTNLIKEIITSIK